MNDDSSIILTQPGATALTQDLRKEIARVVVGQQAVIEEIIIAFAAAGHVLLEGVPGLGKTLLVRALGATFGGVFQRIQFTPDLMPADITGHAVFDAGTSKFRIRHGPIFTHLLLADEINRAPAKTQAALLEVMQEQQVTLEGQSKPVPLPFMVLATQNPIEQEGTYPLPEAQLDRVLLKVLIDYPSEAEEKVLVQQISEGRVGDALDVSSIEAIADPRQIIALQHYTASVRVDSAVADYAVEIVRTTRNWSGIATGASPRGGIALLRGARAVAVLAGRDFVLPDDVRRVALPVLRHRIRLAPDLELEGQTEDRVLDNMIEQLDAPRQ